MPRNGRPELDEQRVRAVFDQVGDIRVAQAVHRQPAGQPGCGRQAANRSSTERGEIRPPRSVSHSAGWPPSARSGGRTSSRYCPNASAAHGITVATARRRGGLPRIALPYRT